ncbi:MAG: hypothetical protein AABZ78_11750 [Chloroflexota bacterium]|mgnify:CR=1 FL=1
MSCDTLRQQAWAAICAEYPNTHEDVLERLYGNPRECDSLSRLKQSVFEIERYYDNRKPNPNTDVVQDGMRVKLAQTHSWIAVGDMEAGTEGTLRKHKDGTWEIIFDGKRNKKGWHCALDVEKDERVPEILRPLKDESNHVL